MSISIFGRPHIFKRGGIWWCGYRGSERIYPASTPVKAYRQWLHTEVI